MHYGICANRLFNHYSSIDTQKVVLSHADLGCDTTWDKQFKKTLSSYSLTDLDIVVFAFYSLFYDLGKPVGCRKSTFWGMTLKVDMPIFSILTCIFFTFNWLTLTSEIICEVSPWGSFLFSLQWQNKICTPGDEAIMKIHRKLFSGIPFNFKSHFLLYLQNYKEFEAEILDSQLETGNVCI